MAGASGGCAARSRRFGASERLEESRCAAGARGGTPGRGRSSCLKPHCSRPLSVQALCAVSRLVWRISVPIATCSTRHWADSVLCMAGASGGCAARSRRFGAPERLEESRCAAGARGGTPGRGRSSCLKPHCSCPLSVQALCAVSRLVWRISVPIATCSTRHCADSVLCMAGASGGVRGAKPPLRRFRAPGGVALRGRSC